MAFGMGDGWGGRAFCVRKVRNGPLHDLCRHIQWQRRASEYGDCSVPHVHVRAHTCVYARGFLYCVWLGSRSQISRPCPMMSAFAHAHKRIHIFYTGCANLYIGCANVMPGKASADARLRAHTQTRVHCVTFEYTDSIASTAKTDNTTHTTVCRTTTTTGLSIVLSDSNGNEIVSKSEHELVHICIEQRHCTRVHARSRLAVKWSEGTHTHAGNYF